MRRREIIAPMSGEMCPIEKHAWRVAFERAVFGGAMRISECCECGSVLLDIRHSTSTVDARLNAKRDTDA